MSRKTTAQRSRTIDIVNASMRRRNAAEKRFQLYGKLAIAAAMLFLLFMFSNIVYKGHTAFVQTFVVLDISFDADKMDIDDRRDRKSLASANYAALIKVTLQDLFPEVTQRQDKRKLYKLISTGASYQMSDLVKNNPDLVGTKMRIWVPVDDEIDMLRKGYIDRDLPESDRRLSNQQIAWVDTLEDKGLLKTRFNFNFFSNGDSRDAELAGILAALSGSFLTLLVTLALAFPIAIATAIYLEEFAPKNKWTDIIEVNINNLAAVPSIVFGLLGLALFINWFQFPRSAPLVGGLVLTLMTLPTIIISSRAALKSVPNAIRQAALAIGASKVQMIRHHVLPLALPGMLTGTIIGMAQALGETAPLLMIGMVAFIVDVPTGVVDPSTVLPVQIFLWADSPERAFVEKTSGAIMVLLVFLIAMNAVAVVVRKKLERRW